MHQYSPAPVNDGSTATTADDSVDEDILSELFMLLGEGTSDGLVSAWHHFVTGMPARFVDIELALAEGDMDRVARVAHSARGTAGTFGARRLSSLAACLEQASGEADATSAAVVLEDMRAEYLVFRDIVSSRLAALPG